MRLRLDTQIALWALIADPHFAEQTRDLIADNRNSIFVSAASVWEIAIKHCLTRGRPGNVPVMGADAIKFFHQVGYDLLSVSSEHAAAVSDLPPLHRDPFDRMIVTQALMEPLRLITYDSMVKAYSESILLV